MRNPRHLRYSICPLLKRCAVCQEIRPRHELTITGTRTPGDYKPTCFACRVKRDIIARFIPFTRIALPAPCPLLLVSSLQLVKRITPKICTGCGIEKPVSEFRWRSDKPSPNARCKKCECADALKYQQRPEVRERTKIRYGEWERSERGHAARMRVINKRKAEGRESARTRAVGLKMRFGITSDDYQQMFDEQGGRCAICREEPRGRLPFAVDHSHSSGSIRGLVCARCNLALGSFRDSIHLLFQLLMYLNRPLPLIDRSRSYPVKGRRDERLRGTYNITLDSFNELLHRQGDCCAICKGHPMGKTRGFHVDHIKGSKDIRGILCSLCNTGLGNLKENPEIIASAIWYLQKAKGKERLAA